MLINTDLNLYPPLTFIPQCQNSQTRTSISNSYFTKQKKSVKEVVKATHTYSQVWRLLSMNYLNKLEIIHYELSKLHSWYLIKLKKEILTKRSILKLYRKEYMIYVWFWKRLGLLVWIESVCILMTVSISIWKSLTKD